MSIENFNDAGDQEEGEEIVGKGFSLHIPPRSERRDKHPTMGYFDIDPDRDTNIAFTVVFQKGHLRDELGKLIANIRALMQNKK